MSSQDHRVSAGVPTGGQYAAYGHSDQVIALAVERRPELEKWPAAFPNPDVSIHVGDDNVLTTTVTIEGTGEIEVYNPGDDVHSVEYNTDGLDGHEDAEAAVEWAKDVHEKIADKIRAEQQAAVERSKAAIIGQVTGDPAPVSDHEMRELYRLHTQAEERAVRYKDLTAASLMSRGVLDTHPDASYVVLSPGRGDYRGIESVAVFGEGQKHLGTYRADAPYDPETDRYEGEDIVAYLPALQSDPKTSYWQKFNVDNFNLTIDVRQAAAWNPAEIA